MPTPARLREKISSAVAACLMLGVVACPLVSSRPAAADPPAERDIDDTDPGPESAPTDTVTVRLEHGATLRMARVEYAPSGFLRVVDHQGKMSYIPIHRVRAVVDGKGKDVTHRVIEERGRVDYLSDSVPVMPRRSPPNPLRSRRAFALTEIGYLFPVNGFDAAQSDHEGSVILDYGAMWNRRRGDALGWVIHADIGSYRARVGPALRYRNWRGDHVALDAEIGVLPIGAEDDRDFEFHGPAFCAQALLILEEDLAIGAQVETRAVRYTGPPELAAGRADVHALDVRLGGKIGGKGGVGSTLILGLVALATAAAVASVGW